MSFLSFSFQGDITERTTTWEGEMATYERDSGKTLDDEIKAGAVLFRLRESQLKTHLLMRFSKLKNGQTSETKWLRFLVRLPLLSNSRHRWTLEQWARGNQAKGGKGSKGAVSSSMFQVRKNGSHFCKLSSL